MAIIQVRKGLFETNSSSVHTLVMCGDSDYDKWKNGEMVYDYQEEKLIPSTDSNYVEWTKMTDEEKENKWLQDNYFTYDEFFDNWDAIPYERFVRPYTTPNGEKIIAFGYFGHD